GRCPWRVSATGTWSPHEKPRVGSPRGADTGHRATGGSVGEDVGSQVGWDGGGVDGEGHPYVGAQVGPRGESVVPPGGGQAVEEQQPAPALGPGPLPRGTFHRDAGDAAPAAGVTDRQTH